MFYPFTKGLTHKSNELAVIWEVETVLAAVLKEANESAKSIRTEELANDAHHVLRYRNLSPKMLRKSRLELKFVLNSGAHLFDDVVLRLTHKNRRKSLEVEFNPVREEMLAAIGNNDDFAAYLRGSSQVSVLTIAIKSPPVRD
jgi:hypothetical protein